MLNKQETCCLQVLKMSPCILHMTEYFIFLLKAKVFSFWHPHFVKYIYIWNIAALLQNEICTPFSFSSPPQENNWKQGKQNTFLPYFPLVVEELGPGGPHHSLKLRRVRPGRIITSFSKRRGVRPGRTTTSPSKRRGVRLEGSSLPMPSSNLPDGLQPCNMIRSQCTGSFCVMEREIL